jgi:hypothetical protein
MVPVSAGTTTCSASLYLDTTAAYKITTTTKSSLGAGTFSDANIGPTDTFNAVNVGGVHPLSGTYCIGVSIDFDHVIHETNEANNTYFIETPIEYVSPPTGIQEQITENLQLRLYPNPVVSTVHLEISDINSNDTAEIMIFNLAGQVASRSIEQPSRNHGNDSFELDVSNLEKGVYHVSVRQGDKVWNGKFLKQ